MDGKSYRYVFNEIKVSDRGVLYDVVSSMNLVLSSMQELSMVLFTFGQINPKCQPQKKALCW